MRIVFLGTGDFGVPALHALRAASHEIMRAISQPDRPAGRGRTIQPTPIHAASDALGLPHVQAADVNALDRKTHFGDAEIGVVAAFGQKIGPEVLAALPRGLVNIHGSLLPKFRGAAPFQRAIIEGAVETGVTVFQLNERWDAGAIWGRKATTICENETADELHDRLAKLGAELIVEVLNDIAAGTQTPETQDTSQVTRAPKLNKTEGTVDWSQPASRIVRRIHGLWSWPAAACMFVSRSGKSERLLIARAKVAGEETKPTGAFPPGTFLPDRTVQAGVGCVRLLEVRPAGKKLMPFEAFANGRQVAPPDRLEPIVSP